MSDGLHKSILRDTTGIASVEDRTIRSDSMAIRSDRVRSKRPRIPRIRFCGIRVILGIFGYVLWRHNMKWITRKAIRVNRVATCWLIRRFIDPKAEFLFVDAEQVATMQAASGGSGFDAPGATYPHRDVTGRCSFAALV